MEITAREMKKSIERIYERLEKVTPVDFDCGKLCGVKTATALSYTILIPLKSNTLIPGRTASTL